jgi:hypothetical protein
MILSKEKQNEIDLSINNMLASLGLDYPENSLLDIIHALGIKVFATKTEKIIGWKNSRPKIQT